MPHIADRKRMKSVIGLFILFSALAFGQSKSPLLDPNKHTVCAMTFNSTDEIEIYKKKMDPKHFNPVVEITEFDKGQNWLQAACQSGIQCDQLIVSGHFAGSFFGEVKEQAVSLEELEKASCDKKCSGIFKNPSEVFLFGCNTLAGEGLKTRTPEQYLQVLREHHFDDYYAQQVVASSYGIQGKSNKVRMQNIFGDDKKIYGFNSIAPSGKTVSPFWTNYLNKEKLDEHIDKLNVAKAVNHLNFSNEVLSKSMCGTSFCQCSGISDQDPEKKLTCILLDSNSTPKQKLFAIQDLMEKDNFIAYVPLINNVIEDGIQSGKFDLSKLSPEDLAILKSLQGNIVIRDMLLSSADKMTMPGPAMENLVLLRSMGMISDGLFNQKTSVKLASVFSAKFNDNDMDVLCEPKLARSFSAAGTFSNTPSSKFDSFYKNTNGISSLGCMGVQNLPDIKTNLASIMKDSPNHDIRASAINLYSAHPAQDTHPLMMKSLNAELSPARVHAGNDVALAAVMGYAANLKRDGTVEQIMFNNLIRKDLGATGLSYTLNFYSKNQPLSLEEKTAILAAVKSSTDPDVQSWGRFLNLK